jgi:DNA (cytosine-5)-methyltransferase 1
VRTAVSLFAGVGGFDLALERNGVKVVASVEIDKKAQEVLKKHFPQSTIFGDITGVTGEQLISAGFIPRSGIITGGFPCQDLSVAGKRAGLGGTRSGLFWEICRLLDETRAQNFILENVPGLLNSNGGADMAVVLEALVERGYRIAYRVLDAQHFGVPQRRRRVFIVGSLGNTGRSPEEILSIPESRARYIAESQSKVKDTTTTIGASVARMRGFGDYEVDSKSSALKARDYKDATDLVIHES